MAQNASIRQLTFSLNVLYPRLWFAEFGSQWFLSITAGKLSVHHLEFELLHRLTEMSNRTLCRIFELLAKPFRYKLCDLPFLCPR